jgi:hypothetical protein
LQYLKKVLKNCERKEEKRKRVERDAKDKETLENRSGVG